MLSVRLDKIDERPGPQRGRVAHLHEVDERLDLVQCAPDSSSLIALPGFFELVSVFCIPRVIWLKILQLIQRPYELPL